MYVYNLPKKSTFILFICKMRTEGITNDCTVNWWFSRKLLITRKECFSLEYTSSNYLSCPMESSLE